ncbi:ESPR-type extended signal peptide-containing protein [Veillonella nakazawae]|nr:ESPR-type extended signal peptide-containing protein [Veillonella nakazawae]MDK7739936.1 ESPR-type extended signal peptide-containing protein [Veillonella nakazawae]
MNKIFKVVWSKSKECYVVVSEVAKNNGGKKKVLASVLAGLAMVGLGATVQAADMNTDTSANTKNQINIWANTTNKENPATPGASTASGSGTANANDIDPSTYGTEIGIAIGAQNKIKPGITTNAGGGSSIAMGIQNEVRGNRNVAIGTNSKTYGENSIALGTKVEAGTGHGIAIGSDDNGKATVAYGGTTPNATGSNVTNAFALAIGSGAQADGRANGTSGGIAIGQLVKATHNNTIAIGVNTTASDSNSVAIGSSAQATQKLSTAYGPNTNANSKGGVAIGTNAAVGTDTGLTTAITGATAVGAYAEAQSENGSAFGRNAKADKNAEKATALGAYATANIAGGVALGSESKTTKGAGEASYNPATGRTNDYKPLTNNAKAALTSTRGAVSIGDDSAGITRQLTGLAAGNQDTDAVNVAQLKAVNLKYAGDSTQVTGSTDVRLNDGTFNVNGDGTLISTEATTTGIKVTAKVGGNITNTDGKAVAPTTNGIATTDNVTQAINNSGWNANASANGGTLTGSATATKVKPGDNVTFSAGKNLTVAQTLGTNTQQYTYALSSTLKDIESIQNGTSKITLNNGGGTTISGGNLSVDDNKITNVATGTAGTDAVNVKQLKDTEKHIKPGTYAVENDGSVTLKYVDGNGTEQTETAKITGIAKKAKVINGQNTTVEDGTDTTDNSVTYKVNVKGDLADISSITNGAGSGKISFEGDQVVKVGGDHPISFDGKGGYVTGLENKAWDLKNPTIVSGRAATEDQLKTVSDGFNNTVKLTGNTGVTGTQKLNQDNGLSFGVVGADNGKYITTTASGSDVVADLSDDAKAKLNHKVEVQGVGTNVHVTEDTTQAGKTIYKVAVDAATAATASTESVVKKADATGDTNIADVSVADNKNVKDPGAQYEVSVSKNAVKDAAREAVTVNNGGNTDNPITVTPTKDENTHNTTYAVTFDGDKAAKQIPLTYKATNNGTTTADQTVKLDKGLNFTGGDYTTASVGADGKVTFDVTLGTAPVVTDGKPGVPGQAGAAGKDGIATVKTVVDTINNSGWKANAKANGGTLDGNSTATVVKPGNTVNYAAGKNLIVKQELETDASNALTGNQTYTYSLNKDIDLTNAGSLTVGDTKVNNDGITIKAPTPAAGTTATTDVKLTNTGLDNGGNKITNVAEGENNTDAVNVKQLKANRTEVKAGDNVVVTSDRDATDNHTVYTVNAVTPAVYTTPDGEKLTKDKDGKFHKVGETAEYTGDIITSFENPKAAAGQTTKDGGMIVNNIGSAIKNQTPTMPAGQTATYLDKLKAAADSGSNVKNAAVNVSDLHNTAEALKSNELHIRPTTSGRTGETVNQDTAGTAESYKYDAATKSVTLKYNDGTGAGVTGTEAKIDLSDLANQITSGYTFKTNATENGGKVVNDAATPAAETAVANGGVVNYAAGKNLTVKQDIEKDGTGAATGKQTYTYALADEIGIGEKGQPGVAGKDGVDGKIGVNGKDGSSVVINGKDGSIGMTGPKGQNGKDGINGRDGADISMTSAKGEQVLVNRDPAHNTDTDKAERIVYVPKDANGNPIQGADGKNIVREVATMDDGLKFTGNNTSTENKQKLGSLVKVQGEGTQEGTTVINPTTGEKEIVLSDGTTKFESAKDNIAVVADGTDTLTVKLNKNLKGLDSVQTKTVVLGDPNATNGTTNITYNPTEKRIEYVTPDAAGTGTTTNKVATTDDIWTIQGNGTDVKPVNGKVNVKAGDNVVITTPTTADGSMTISAVSPVVYTTPSGEKLTKKSDGKFYKADGTEYTDGDIIASFENPNTVPAGKTSTTDGSMIINNVGSAIKNQTGGDFLAKLDAAANTTTGTPNAAVNVSDLKSTADALKANERHIAPTTVPNTSNENTGGTPNATGTANVYKYDATNKTVTLTYNDGNGKAVTDTKAVIDFSDLSTGGTGASSWNIASDKVSATEGTVVAGSAAAQNIADGKTVTMQAGKNLTVNQTNDAAGNASVAFSLDKDLTNLDKVVVNGKDGVAGKDGVTIVGPQGATGAPGMPGTNGIDGKVGITGKDGKDAVSISGKDGIGTIGLTGPQGPAGQDGRGVDITTDHGTQTLYKPEASNNNQSERIVYVPKDKDGNPLKDTDGNPIKREVATMDDGLKFTGNNESTENKQKLGSLVKVQGEGTKESTAVDPVTGKKYVVLSDGTTKFESAKDNIAVEADGTDTLTVKLNKDLKGLNSIQLGGNTIQSNGDNITFTTNGGTTKTVATTDQLWTIQANGIDVPATNGKVNVVGKDGITVAKNAAGNLEISGTGLGTMNGFDVTANNGATTKTIKDGNKVDFNATSNLTVKQTSDANGTHIEYSLNKDVDLGNTGSLKTGDTTINNDGFKNGNTTVGGNGMTINNPTDPTKTVSLTKDGLNNGGNQIKNVAPGTDGTDAVNVDQLNQAVATAASTEKVIRKNDTNNLAKVDTQSTHAAGDKGETYIVSVDKDDVKDAAREAVEVTGSGVIKVTADSTTTPHKTTYDVAYDPDKAADVTKISYKSSTSTDAGSQAPKKTTLADGLDFTSDDNSVAITTGANGKVNFKVDTSGIQGKAFNLDVNKEGTGKVENAQTAAATPSVEKGTKFVAGNNLSIRHDAINGDNKYDHQVTYALNSDLKGITSISNNTTAGGPTMNFGPNELSITGGNLSMGNGTNNNKIVNVAPGTDKSDVATVGQLTKVTSNDNTVAINKTTDADGAPVYDLSVQGGGHDPRVDQLGEEIGRVGAQGAALAALKPIQYDPLEPTQIMAGYGNYRGNSAIAMGVAHYKNESTLMHAGVSWAGGSRHMMANAGVTWKVGNRDSEAAVADRYRKGPISSAYAMQQEMASVKAQNAGLKTEVSDLKAENEQMKAQIAAMMAKLGM